MVEIVRCTLGKDGACDFWASGFGACGRFSNESTVVWLEAKETLVLPDASVFAFTADFITTYFGLEGLEDPQESVSVCVSAGLNDCTLGDVGFTFRVRGAINLFSERGLAL